MQAWVWSDGVSGTFSSSQEGGAEWNGAAALESSKNVLQNKPKG